MQLIDLQTKLNRTINIVSHDLDEAFKLGVLYARDDMEPVSGALKEIVCRMNISKRL